MSTLSGDIGPEEEDGAGCGGLVPTKAEREQEKREAHAAKCVKACAGLPDGALDGGWTAAGIRSYAKKLEDEIKHLRKATEYYRAGLEKRAPKWVPCRVLLDGPVRGDYPIGHTTIAEAGEHDCESNRYGAISVLATNGERLGVKPAEFDVVAWRLNDADSRRASARSAGVQSCTTGARDGS